MFTVVSFHQAGEMGRMPVAPLIIMLSLFFPIRQKQTKFAPLFFSENQLIFANLCKQLNIKQIKLQNN